jgi:hypothetical protein
MKIRILILYLLLSLIFFSCKKEELGRGPSNVKVAIPLLSEVLLNNQPLFKYTYDDSTYISEEQSKYYIALYNYVQNQISTVEYYGNENVLSKDSLTRTNAINNPTWVTMGSGINGGNLSYIYNTKNQLIETKFTSPLSQDTLEYSEFQYDNKNRISRQLMYWNGSIFGYVDYLYDGNGNLTTESLYYLTSVALPVLFSQTQYSFDSKHNPYKCLSNLIIPGIYTNANNIIQETRTIFISSTSDTVLTTRNTYAYNIYGYPSTKNGNILFTYE